MKLDRNYFYTLNNKKYLIIILLISFLIHLVTINFQPVNDEFIFFKGADFIFTLEKKIVNIFFEYNANTLGFSYIIAFFKLILPFLETSQISKLLSFLSLFFFASSLTKIYIIFRPKISFKFFILFVLLNPLIWNYSFRGVPDAFSASLCLFAVSNFLYYRNLKLKYLYILIFSLGVMIKPFNGILLLIIIYSHFFFKKENQIYFLLLFFNCIVMLYFIFNYYFFGFFITPPSFSDIFEPRTKVYLVTFTSYLGFIFFLSYPFFLKTIFLYFSKSYIKNILFYLFVILLSIYISQKFDLNLTEMNFGFISNFIDYRIFKVVILFNSLLLIFLTWLILRGKDKAKLLILIVSTLVFVIIMSFTHSAQRYLMILVPLIYVFFIRHNISLFTKLSILSLYIIINFLIFGNFYNNNKTITDIVSYLNNNNIIEETHPGYIGQHALNNFTEFHSENRVIKKSKIFENKLYKVVESVSERNIILYETDSNFLFLKRKLFVIKNL